MDNNILVGLSFDYTLASIIVCFFFWGIDKWNKTRVMLTTWLPDEMVTTTDTRLALYTTKVYTTAE